MYLYLLGIGKLHTRRVTGVNQITQTGFEWKFQVNWKPDAFHPWRKVTTELPPNKSKEGIIQLICAFSLARDKSTKFTEDMTMENQGCLCRNDLPFRWIHLITKLSWGVYQIALFHATFFYPASILLLQCPVAALPSLTRSWSSLLTYRLSCKNSTRFCCLLFPYFDFYKPGFLFQCNPFLWADLIFNCSGIPETCLTALQKPQQGGGGKLSAPISFNHSTQWGAL